LLVAGVSWVLGRGEMITMPGLFGMVLVAAGCLILPMRSFSHRFPPAPAASPSRKSALLLALIAAIGTTGYTVIDDHALSLLRQLPSLAQSSVQVTILYTYLEGITISIWLAVLVLAVPSERRELSALTPQTWFTAALAGIFMLLAYGLVLIAMAYVRDVSYVSAFRQTSIPIGALIGLLLEKEKAYPPKLVGILAISFGLALVALG
jgi:drug/metabolite transporter (DMT)-like permease